MHFRIIEHKPLPAPGGSTFNVYSLQIELLQGGAPTWFTIAKNRDFNALLILAGNNKLAYEIVRA